MKPKNILFLFLALIVYCSTNIEQCFGQWEKLNCDDNIYINNFALKGNKLFAGTSANGVLISNDNGVSWENFKNVLSNQNVRSLLFFGQDLLAGTWESGIFISTNEGLDWIEINNGINNKKVLCLAASGTSIYSGMEYTNKPGCLYKTTDKGNNWKLMDNGFPEKQSCVSIAVIENNILAASQYEGLYMSTNDGKEWKRIGFERIEILNIAVSGKTIFVSTRYGGVQYSTNYGDDWEYVNESLSYESVSSLYAFGLQLFSGFRDGIFCSSKSYCDYHPINNKSELLFFVTAIIYFNEYIYAGTNGFSIWRQPLMDFSKIK